MTRLLTPVVAMLVLLAGCGEPEQNHGNDEQREAGLTPARLRG